jgi:hypothetical protein
MTTAIPAAWIRSAMQSCSRLEGAGGTSSVAASANRAAGRAPLSRRAVLLLPNTVQRYTPIRLVSYGFSTILIAPSCFFWKIS